MDEINQKLNDRLQKYHNELTQQGRKLSKFSIPDVNSLIEAYVMELIHEGVFPPGTTPPEAFIKGDTIYVPKLRTDIQKNR